MDWQNTKEYYELMKEADATILMPLTGFDKPDKFTLSRSWAEGVHDAKKAREQGVIRTQSIPDKFLNPFASSFDFDEAKEPLQEYTRGWYDMMNVGHTDKIMPFQYPVF